MVQGLSKHDISDLERGFEYELEAVDEDAADLETSFESFRHDEDDAELELGDQELESGGDYADRFLELSEREFEDEADREHEIDSLLGEMERDFFFGKLARAAKRGVKGLVKKGLKAAKGLPAFQAVKGITDFARKNLRGNLGNIAKLAMQSGLIPGGAAALPLLQALGFMPGQGPEQEREAWQRFSELTEDAYGTLAESLHSEADDPAEAAALAARALKTAMGRAQGARTGRGRPAGGGRAQRVRLRPGDRLIIEVV